MVYLNPYNKHVKSVKSGKLITSSCLVIRDWVGNGKNYWQRYNNNGKCYPKRIDYTGNEATCLSPFS